MHFFHNGDKNMTSQNNLGQDRPQGYLTFWGNGYPYLNESKNSMQRWLPIPENSKAQRLIRDINSRSEAWIMGNDFMMGPISRPMIFVK